MTDAKITIQGTTFRQVGGKHVFIQKEAGCEAGPFSIHRFRMFLDHPASGLNHDYTHSYGNHPETRPYEGNDLQYTSIFGHERYAEWIKQNSRLQDYWRHPLYLIERKPDGYLEVASNLHRGDFFGCGRTSQVGKITHKIMIIQSLVADEYKLPTPHPDKSVSIKYRIAGDIGGHWYEPTHDCMTNSRHFIWLPTPMRLMFSGFREEAMSLMRLVSEITEEEVR